MSTLSSSMMRFADTTEPEVFRQFAQWHRCPRGLVNSSLSFMVTVMLPQRQLPDNDSLNVDKSCRLGSPISSGMMENVEVLSIPVAIVHLKVVPEEVFNNSDVVV
jgi:hypothetical protein